MSQSITIQTYQWSGPYSEWRRGAEHDHRLCADVRAAWMAPGERLILRTCEIIGNPHEYLYDDHYPPAEPETRGKDYRHIPFTWDASEAPNRLTADCLVEGKGRFTLDLESVDDYLDIRLSVRNDTSAPMGPLDWAFCAISLESPMLRNPDHDRIFIYTGGRLHSFLDVNGKPGMHIIQVAGAGGYVPTLHQTLAQGTVQAQESVVIVESVGGRHCAALGFEQSYTTMGCTGNMCFHMDPYFGRLSPGEEKRILGRLYLIEGNRDDALARYRVDFRS
jgi:hypothetical protein